MRRALSGLVTFTLLAGLAVAARPTATVAQEVITARGKVFAGMYSGLWESSDEFDALAAWAGKRATFGGTFHTVTENATWSGNTDWILDQVWQGQATPFANVDVRGSAAAIAAGHHDDEIRAWAMAVKEWLNRGGGRSLFIAPLQEMNGDWVSYGMDPANFKGAYARFRDIFRSLGMDETKVRWAFAPNGWSTPPYKIADYYPGDAVVDLIGISTYNFGACVSGARWTTVYETMGGALHELRTSVSASKPYVIGQTASSSCGGDKDAWLREMLAFTADDQNVVAFIYFNIDKETDWKAFYSSWGWQGFRDGMQNPTTQHQWPLTEWFRPGPIPFQAYTPPFWDDDGSVHESDIIAIYQAQITKGCNTTGEMYCPDGWVTRGQMAAFLARAKGLPPSAINHFWDDNGHLFEPNINSLADAGTTRGCNAAGDMFCPHDYVTRGQMAAFLVRALALPPASGDHFSDDAGHFFEREINALAEAGITKGCHTSATFCPDGYVTRAQMASFLARAFLSA